MRDSNHENIFLIIVFANVIRRSGRLKRGVQIHSRLYFTGKIQLMTADIVSPTKPISRRDHLKIPLLCIKQRPSKLLRRPVLYFHISTARKRRAGSLRKAAADSFPGRRRDAADTRDNFSAGFGDSAFFGGLFDGLNASSRRNEYLQSGRHQHQSCSFLPANTPNPPFSASVGR